MVLGVRVLLDLHLRSCLAVLHEQPLVKRTLPAQVQDTVVGPGWCLTCGVNVLREQAEPRRRGGNRDGSARPARGGRSHHRSGTTLGQRPYPVLVLEGFAS